MNQTTHRKSSIFGTLFTLLFIAAAVWCYFNRQYFIDQFTVWQFKPTTEVAEIAERASMNNSGKFYYYASRPTLDSTANFNNECQRKEQGNAIIGCYKDGRIYIYDIDDARLDGVKEVTAAHEMLHAVFERLPKSKKDRLSELLQAEEAKIDDELFSERMDYYRRNQPGQHINELHSIIGTEIADISDELEEYYKKYFTDRQVIVGLHAKYSDKFNELRKGATELKSQLESLSAQINAASEKYNQDVARLNQEIAGFNSRAQAGNFTSQEQFSIERAGLVSRSNSLNNDRAVINNLIAEYESTRVQYNSVVDESNALQQAVDSSLAPAPSV